MGNYISEKFKKHLEEELTKEFKKVLDEAPWWCGVCGEGGNYEGERPDEYWIPPEDHVCVIVKPPTLRGITGE